MLRISWISTAQRKSLERCRKRKGYVGNNVKKTKWTFLGHFRRNRAIEMLALSGIIVGTGNQRQDKRKSRAMIGENAKSKC